MTFCHSLWHYSIQNSHQFPTNYGKIQNEIHCHISTTYDLNYSVTIYNEITWAISHACVVLMSGVSETLAPLSWVNVMSVVFTAFICYVLLICILSNVGGSVTLDH
jgi:hypothetical protein